MHLQYILWQAEALFRRVLTRWEVENGRSLEKIVRD